MGRRSTWSTSRARMPPSTLSRSSPGPVSATRSSTTPGCPRSCPTTTREHIRRGGGMAATASSALSTRLPTTVTRSRAGRIRSGTCRVRHDDELDAPFVGLGGLAEQQRCEHRFVDARRHAVRQLLGDCELGGGELQRVCRAAELDQGDNGVHPVRCLVRLRRAATPRSPRTESSSPVRACRSVWSRRVTTVPRTGRSTGPWPGSRPGPCRWQVDLVGTVAAVCERPAYRAAGARARRSVCRAGSRRPARAAGWPRRWRAADPRVGRG